MANGILKLTALLGIALAAIPALASQSITIQGRVVDSSGNPVNGASTQFRVKILTPDANRCVLYDETQTLNLSTSSGLFSINVNNGSGSRSAPLTYTLEQALSNRLGFSINSLYCASGSGTVTYSPTATDGRKVVIQFRDPGSMASFETIPEMDLNPVPYAIESRGIGGYSAASLLRVEDAGVPASVASLTSSNFTELQALLSGTSSNYMSSTAGSTTGARLPTVAGAPSTPAVGSMWLDTSGSGSIKFKDSAGNIQTLGTSGGGTISTITAGTGLTGGGSTATVSLALSPSGVTGAGTPVGSASAIPVLTYDTYGRLTSVTSAAISGTLPSGTSGEFLKSGGGSTWASSVIKMGDLKNVAGTSPLFGAVNCTASQSMYWDSGTDQILCQNISVGNASISDVAWSKVTGKPTAIKDYATDAVTNEGGTPSFLTGTESALPTVHVAGRIYFASDTKKIFRDNGTTWDQLAVGASGTLTDVLSGAGISVSGTGATRTIALDNTGKAAGTFYKVTTDADGRVSSGAGALVAADIPDLDWTKITTGKPTAIKNYAADAMTNEGGTPSFLTDTEANLPTTHVAGRIFVASDTKKIFRDTGSAWDLIASAAGAGGTLTDVTSGSGIAVTGTGATRAVALDNTGKASGTFYKVTTGADGRVNSGATALIASDIPDLDWAKITSGKPTSIAGYATDAIVNLAGTKSFTTDNTSTKPTGHVAGRFYVDVASQKISYDDGTNWIDVASNGGAGFSGSLGGEVRGTQSATTVHDIGGILNADIVTHLTSVQNATDTATASRLVKRDASGDFAGRKITATEVIVKGSAHTASLTADPSANYTLKLPDDKATVNGQVLSSDTNGVLSWSSPSSSFGSIAVTAPVTNTSGTIGMPSATTSRDGYLTQTDWNTFSGKLSSALNAARIWVGNASNVAAPVAPSGNVTLDNAGKFTVTGIRDQSISAAGTVAGQVLRYSATDTWTPQFLTMKDLRSTVTGTQALTSSCTAGKTMYWDSGSDSLACQDISIAAGTQITGQLPIANGGTGAASASSAFNALSPLTTKGDLLVHNGTGNIRLPAGATDGQVLKVDSTQASGLAWGSAAASELAGLSTNGLVHRTGAGAFSPATVSSPLSFSSGTLGINTGSNGVLLDGGNTTSAAMNIGSNTGQDVNFRTNSTTRLTLAASGGVGIGGSPAASAALDVASTTKTFLPPRMTTTQRDAIASPSAGSVIYNSTKGSLEVYNGSAWSSPNSTNLVSASSSSLNQTGTGTVDFTVRIQDSANEFNLSTNVFQPTTQGYYLIIGRYRASGMADGGHALIYIQKNGSNLASHYNRASINTNQAVEIVDVVQLNGTTDNVSLAYNLSSGGITDADFRAYPLTTNLSGAGSADNLGNHTLAQNLIAGSNWISGDGDSEGIRIDSTGRVGIGSASPAYPLDVNGSARATQLCIGTDCRSAWPSSSTPGGSTGQIQYNNAGALAGSAGLIASATGTLLQAVAQAASDIPLLIKAAASQTASLQEWQTSAGAVLAKITSDGKLGIGTASPSSKLEVVGSAGATLKIVDGNQANGRVLTSDANGQASWQVAPATGLTSVGLTMPGIFSVTNSPLTANGAISVAASGTSGGIPYFNSSATLASSGAIGLNQVMVGGNFGPTTVSGTGTLGQVLTSNGAGAAPTWQTLSSSGGTMKYAVVYRNTTDQALTLGSNVIAQFNAVGVDTGTFWSAGSPSRLTVPSGVSLVRLCTNIAGSTSASFSRFGVSFYKNGSGFNGGTLVVNNPGDNSGYANGCSSVLAVAPGDYFEAAVYSGGSGTAVMKAGVTTWFSIEAVSGTSVASSGSGTSNYMPMWTSSTALGDSPVAVSSGYVGIGTSTPGTTLDVNGGVRPGSSTVVTATCNASNEGILRYNYTSHALEVCNGTAWLPSGSGLTSRQYFSTPGAVSFTVPTGVTSVRAYVAGAGGGGSGSGGIGGNGANTTFGGITASGGQGGNNGSGPGGSTGGDLNITAGGGLGGNGYGYDGGTGGLGIKDITVTSGQVLSGSIGAGGTGGAGGGTGGVTGSNGYIIVEWSAAAAPANVTSGSFQRITASLASAPNGGTATATCATGYTLISWSIVTDLRTQHGTNGWTNGGSLSCGGAGNTITILLGNYSGGSPNTTVECQGLCVRN